MKLSMMMVWCFTSLSILSNPLTANHNNCSLLSHLLVTLKVIFANSVDPDQTAPQEQSDQGPHCLPVCKNRFERFASIFRRRHKQTTFSHAGFLGVLRVKSFRDNGMMIMKGSMQ